MRRLAPFLALFVWMAPPLLTRATPADNPNPQWLTGQLLVAAPGIGDPRFDGSVIYVVHHGRDGAFGLAINRPVARRKIADILEALGQDNTGITGEAQIFAGGPVQPEIGFVLHTTDYRDDRTLAVDAHFAVTSDADILRAIAAGKGPKKSLIAFGYAGWGPGQLEDEISHNDWYVTPASAALLFDEDRDSVWQSAYDKRTLRL